MFYLEEINGKKILKSSILDGLNHFFTTRESIIKTKEIDLKNLSKRISRIFASISGLTKKT